MYTSESFFLPNLLLYSLRLTLWMLNACQWKSLWRYTQKNLVMPFFTGHVSRGLLLHFIRLVDPAASALLHELDVSKPYSVTPKIERTSETLFLERPFLFCSG